MDKGKMKETRFSAHGSRARDPGNKAAASAHGMGSGGLAVDAVAIGCLGAERRGERFFRTNFKVCSGRHVPKLFKLGLGGHKPLPILGMCLHLAWPLPPPR